MNIFCPNCLVEVIVILAISSPLVFLFGFVIGYLVGEAEKVN